jgi:hypothetical protein
MGFKLGAIVGFGAGYYLGAKAGRERYEQLNRWAEKVRQTDAYEAASAKAMDLADEGYVKARDMASEGVAAARSRFSDQPDGNEPAPDSQTVGDDVTGST